MASAMSPELTQLQRKLSLFLKENFASRNEDPESDEKDSDEPPYRARQRRFASILAELCDLVRKSGADEKKRDTLVSYVDKLINIAVSTNNKAGKYRCGSIFENGQFESFGHATGQLVETNEPALDVDAGSQDMVMSVMKELMIGVKTKPKPSFGKSFDYTFGDQKGWDTTIQQPHPSTTLLSRFSQKYTAPWSSPHSSPMAQAVYEARCEIGSGTIQLPTSLCLSADSSCLAITCAGTDHLPVLHHYLLSDSTHEFPPVRTPPVGLADVSFTLAMDVARKLIFIADEVRIKAINWETQLPVHTLSCSHSRGPMTVLPNGTLVRASQGKLDIWDIDAQPTHGPTGKTRVGQAFVNRTGWAHAPTIELSAGSAPTSTIEMAKDLTNWDVGYWVAHPSQPGTMITSAQGHCAMLSIDLEHGGKVGTKFIGQGGFTHNFSTEASNPQVFATGCEDGHIRLWDVRHPLPVLTVAVGNRSQPAAALAYPSGIPTLFGGSEKAGVVKVFDVRGREMVYELSGGNNRIGALAWDSTRNTLWATAESTFVDRMGSRRGYRPLKLPPYIEKREKETRETVDAVDEAERVHEYRTWPGKAYHRENYFGDVFDAGGHRLLRYAFKPDADPSFTPAYGH